MERNILLLVVTFFVHLLLAQQPVLNSNSTKGATPLNSHHSSLNTSSTYAVVIGISDYQDKDIPDLRFADKDAEAFANFLRSPAGGSLDADHLQVLTNTQATAGRIAEALDALIEKANKDDQIIIYFSGHGDVEGKKLTQPGFLLCWDAPSRVYMGGGTYSLSFLQEVVSTLSVQNQSKVVVITDACHAGKLAGSQIGGAQLTTANLAKQYANEVKILSCQPNEYSLEGEQWGGGRGVFSYHLVDGLFGLADRNNDGLVTLGEIDRYLEDKVTGEVAPQSQVPILLGNKTDRMATVNANILADLKKNRSGNMTVFAATESRGFEDEILAKVDSNVVLIYKNFKKAILEKRFLSPMDDCAEGYYAQLEKAEILSPLRGIMKRNYAAALQDDAQQVLNTMLKSGLTSDILSAAKAAKIYQNYPTYLDRAAELLGSGHYMYAALKARSHYFEGTLQTEKSEQRRQLFQALQWQAEMPHAYVALIRQYPAERADSAEFYAVRAMQIAPAWVKPYLNLAEFYQKAKQPVKAEELLIRAGKLDSNSILVWYDKANFYSSQKKWDKSEYWYLKAIAGSGDDICFPCAYNNLGSDYSDSGRGNEAQKLFKKAIQLDSTFVNAYFNLGNYYNNTQRYAKAEELFKKVIQLDSTYVDAYSMLGNVYSYAKRYTEAEEQYKKGIQLDSTFAGNYVNLGLLYINTGRYIDAQQQYNNCIRIDSNNAVVYNHLGYVNKIMGNLAEAEEYYKKAIRLDSNSLNSYINLGSIYVETRRHSEAEPLYKNALRLDSMNARLYFQMGLMFQSKGQLVEAEEQFKKSIHLDSTSVNTYNSLGILCGSTGRYVESEQQFRKAIQHDSLGLNGITNLGLLFNITGRYAEAEQQFRKTLRLDSSHLMACYNLGITFLKTERHSEAEQQFKKTTQLDSNHAYAYYNLSGLQSLQNRIEEAFYNLERALKNGYNEFDALQIDSSLVSLRAQKVPWGAMMKKAIVTDSTNADAWNMLGQVYIRARNYDQAESAMSKAISLDAMSATYRSNLGFIYFNLARYTEAEAALKKAIAIDSTFANPRKHLGMVCFKTNRPDDARQNFLKALKLNPDYSGAILGIAYLHAAEGKAEEAIDYVEQAISKGATLEQLEKDEDLAPLRSTPEWNTLMKKHFPDKFKD